MVEAEKSFLSGKTLGSGKVEVTDPLALTYAAELSFQGGTAVSPDSDRVTKCVEMVKANNAFEVSQRNNEPEI